ncbi:peptidoglycan-binding domain-containing protein [Streptomyces blastmyceticus]|uniref:Peptidoglycan binding-like domain-containing protein n=1 Tax=Streptomyces blastmyceticus TaxID=68180 RepID=A0ABP3GHC8_9ACTN
MRNSVRANFAAFSARLEGRVDHMYLDRLGNVTIAIGNKIDPLSDALNLAASGAQLLRNDGTPASDAEITDEWNRVKTSSGPTQLHLDDSGIDTLVDNKLTDTESALTPFFSGFADWPADAQMGLLSLGWAMGPNRLKSPNFPNFHNAVDTQDWFRAARECNMAGADLVKRNAVDRGLFRNAAVSVEPPPSDPETLLLPIPGSRPQLQLNSVDGPSDDDVGTLQRMFQPSRLNLLAPGSFDPGKFDAATDAAVRGFQSGESGFPVTGVVAELTWAALGEGVPLA